MTSPLTEDEAAGLIARQWSTGDEATPSAADALERLMASVMYVLPMYVVDSQKATREQKDRIGQLSFEFLGDLRVHIRDMCGATLTYALQTFLAEYPDAPLVAEGGDRPN